MNDPTNYNAITDMLMVDLKAIIVKVLEEQISEYIKNNLKDSIWFLVYSQPSTMEWRSNELPEAVVVSVVDNGDSVDAMGYIDHTKLSHTSKYHNSWVDNSDQREWIAHWLEYGNAFRGGNPIVTYEGRYYFKWTFEKLESMGIAELKKAFRNLGFDTE